MSYQKQKAYMKLQGQNFRLLGSPGLTVETKSIFDVGKLDREKNQVLNYHIALSLSLDLEIITREAEEGKRPRHAMWGLSQTLGATIHRPNRDLVSAADKMRAQIIGKPEHWALARALSSQLSSNDLIYCTGEDIGIPIALLCGCKQERPKIVVYVSNLDRPRSRLALTLFSLSDRIDLFVTCSRHQADFLCRYLCVPETRILVLSEQTDTTFFTPSPASATKVRPIIASGGLEKRDYQTLAKATWDLEVDVKICAFSPNKDACARALPKIVPENMSFRFYDWLELLQLYRDAALVVVSLIDNNYSAGLTTMLEAMACRRPVVITRTQGLIADLVDAGYVTGVKPNDSDDLRQAIAKLLADPQKAEAQAQRGYELVLKQHHSEQYIETLAKQLSLL